MKSLKAPFAVLILALALAQTSLAGIIHTPGATPPEDPPRCEEDHARAEDYSSKNALTAYAFEIMRTVVSIF